MQELAIQLNSIPAAQEPAYIKPFSFFDEYISYVDRGKATTAAYTKNLRQFVAWCCYANIVFPIQRADILAYRDYLGSEHEAIELDTTNPKGWKYRTDKNGSTYTVRLKLNTIKQYIQVVINYFKWLESAKGYPSITENIHTPRIKDKGHKKEALKAADVEKIEKSILLKASEKIEDAAANKKDTKGRTDRATEQGKRLFAMYLLAVNCGLRTIEINRANISDLEIKEDIAYLHIHGKGHQEADTKKTLAPAVKEALEDYLNSRTDAKTQGSPLFVSTGNRSKGKRIATTTISTMLKKAMQEAGYNSEKLTAHSLRHTAGSCVQEITGQNLYLTQQYMRHENPRTTEIYIHNAKQQEQETDIAKRLYNHYHGTDEKEDELSKLGSIVASLNKEQLQTLSNIAAAMAK